MKYLKRFNESHFDLADDIANDLYPRFLQLKKDGEVITPEYFENYMKERGAKSDIIDDVMSSLVNLGFEFDNMKTADQELTDVAINPFDRWNTSEDLQNDLQNYIGKKIEDFEYGDKLKAYKYVENNQDVQIILNSSDKGLADIKQQITDFLANLKQYFEL
jgi:hypothetical protein